MQKNLPTHIQWTSIQFLFVETLLILCRTTCTLPNKRICTVCGDHALTIAYKPSRGYWHHLFSTIPAKLRMATLSCDICLATTTVLTEYADWDWDDESTKMHFASEPGLAMVLWWLDKKDKAERHIELYSPAGKIHWIMLRFMVFSNSFPISCLS